jgi:AraC-like DNA-binding protein
MLFLKTSPEILKKEIKFFYSVNCDKEQSGFPTHRRLPDGTLDVVFNLDKPTYISKDGEKFKKMPEISLTGLYTDKCFLQYEDDTHTVGAVLQPGYAHLFVSDTLGYHKSDTKDAALIFGNSIHHLFEKMQQASDEKEKHRMLEKFFISRLRKNRDDYSINSINNSLAEIHSSNGTVLINNLCKKYFMSERNFRRKFIEYVGMSPKKYAAIIRIKAFCSLRRLGLQHNKIINNLEYADHSHLHKEFNKITGTSAVNFFKELTPLSEGFLYFI